MNKTLLLRKKRIVYKYLRYLWVYNRTYNAGRPIVDDLVFERLYTQLYKIFKCWKKPLVIDSKVVISPDTQKIKHEKTLLSLNKVTSYEKIVAHFVKYPGDAYILQPKYDGLSLSAVYKNGKIEYILTRGTGEYGDNVTHKLSYINFLPKIIPYKHSTVSIYGELVVSKTTFKQQNIQSHRGLIMQVLRNQSVSKNIRIDFVVYDIYSDTLRLDVLQRLRLLKQWGFFVSKTWYIKDLSLSLKKQITFSVTKQLHNLDYEVDGMVFKINSIKYEEEYGDNKKFPLSSLAYKFLIKFVTTKILYIRWSYGATGRYTPIVYIQPVWLFDSQIVKINFFNAMALYKNRLRPGTIISVHKAGTIIPHIHKVIKHTKTYKTEFLRYCVYCKSRLGWSVESFKCFNIFCSEKQIMLAIKLAKKDVLDINHISSSGIRKLFNYYGFTHIIDLFTLNKDQLLNAAIENFQEKSYTRLYNSLQSAKCIKNEVLPLLLGIFTIGTLSAKNYMKTFGNLYLMYRYFFFANHTIDNLGLSLNRMKEIRSALINNESLLLIRKIYRYQRLGYINIMQNSEESFCKIVITGTLSKTRSEFAELISKHYTVYPRITKGVEFLVVGENPSEEKIKQANTKKIVIINESDLLKKIDDKNNNRNT